MKNILTFFFVINILNLFAQNEIDALRYSKQDIIGTAKFSSMAGSFGALGGDFTNLSYNPAGIGLYQNTEIMFSPSVDFNKTKSYYNTQIETETVNISLANIGLIYTIPSKNSNWNRINIGLGLNKLNDYERNINIEGKNNQTSLADKIYEIAQGKKINELDNFYTYPAFETYLLDTITGFGDNGEYILNINSNSNKNQKEILSSKGEQNEIVISLGGSMNDKLYFGATIGIPMINYYEYSRYSENDFENTANKLESFELNEELSVYGEGINLKTGIIARISEYFSVGLALHSPTIYKMEETFSTEMFTYTDTNYFNYFSGYNYFEYELITPGKAIISLSSKLNDIMLLNIDYEVIDFSSTSMSSNQYDFTTENNTIDTLFTKVQNIRIGTDIQLGKLIKNFEGVIFRSGYARYSNPYSNKNNDFLSENYSFGFGTNTKNYFLDIAYVLSQYENTYQLYSKDYIDPINLISTDHHIIFTLGFRY